MNMETKPCERCGRQVIQAEATDTFGKPAGRTVTLEADVPIYLVQAMVGDTPKELAESKAAIRMESAFMVDHTGLCGRPPTDAA